MLVSNQFTFNTRNMLLMSTSAELNLATTLNVETSMNLRRKGAKINRKLKAQGITICLPEFGFSTKPTLH